ncbi:MAG TPA: phenylalanine--tRNA ligase subunit beta [Micromonosporaceae bacterium]
MRISLDWLSDLVDLPEVEPSRLAHDLTLATVEVEDVVTVDGDVILDIDNKSLTNRPDLWGHYGIARELAAIYQLPLRPLPSAPRPPLVADGSGAAGSGAAAARGLVGGVDPALCRRFAALRFRVDTSVPTPRLIRERLARIGEASVNLCVDLSNYVMFTVGQPTHVYDADRLALPLSAGYTPTATSFDLLNGQSVDLPAGVPVITDATGVAALAGVVGGAATAVGPASREFVLEAATFRAQPIRRATQRLGLRTEASARFEKGLDTQRVDAAVDLFLSLLREAAPDASVTALQDVTLQPTAPALITVDRDFLDRRIGQRLDDDELYRVLDGLGFDVAVDGTTLRVAAPTWRSTGDVSLPHDLVEEVGRIHGYDRLIAVRPTIALTPVRRLNRRPLDRAVREQLATRAGLREVLTYPWVADHLLAATGFDKERLTRFQGAPAPDRDALRPSLIPNLLDAVVTNLRYHPSFGIFEVGTVFGGRDAVPPRHGTAGRRRQPDDDEVLPPTALALGIALVGDDGVDLFRRAKGIVEMLRRHCHLIDLPDTDPASDVDLSDTGRASGGPACAGGGDPAWADRSARLAIRVGATRVGTLALVTPRARRLTGIDGVQVACAEIELTRLAAHRSRENRFVPLPDLPEADFDLSVVVADTVAWQTVEATARQADALVAAVRYVDEYRGASVPDGHRSLTLRVTLRPRHATLTADVIAAARGRVLDALGRQVRAYLR